MLAGVDVDELQHALGGVVLESAYMERVLRAAFSALVGSKYTAVVDGRLTASTLIDDCRRLARYRMDIPAHAIVIRPTARSKYLSLDQPQAPIRRGSWLCGVRPQQNVACRH
jgi:hypothetical protein